MVGTDIWSFFWLDDNLDGSSHNLHCAVIIGTSLIAPGDVPQSRCEQILQQTRLRWNKVAVQNIRESKTLSTHLTLNSSMADIISQHRQHQRWYTFLANRTGNFRLFWLIWAILSQISAYFGVILQA